MVRADKYVGYSSDKFEIVQNSCTVVAKTTSVDIGMNSNSETDMLKTLKKGSKLSYEQRMMLDEELRSKFRAFQWSEKDVIYSHN
ncbi:hypothetical protein BpHYR1_025085 [Brachionus plicatilis]|uniref:Uncharacterized protein n=1 Tax=Brachionus plicatilis TaxID=10195 RepID=A0A3M7RGQ6_BRAPC|nr:hypothetical protein BpHYR1_025085 [Brachionus plicatilis]